MSSNFVHSRLNLEDSEKLERTCLIVILGDMNIGYEAALEIDTHSNRREMRSRPEKTASMQTMLADIFDQKDTSSYLGVSHGNYDG